jgi:AraC-like DNA-binding protein
MQYREFKAEPPLSNYIECFWALDGNGHRDPTHPPERLLPDGCIELVLNFEAPFHERKEDGRFERQPTRLIVGQMTRPVLIAPTGVVQILGIRFAPGGTLPFFPVPPDEFTNVILPIDDIAPSLDRDLSQRLYDVPELPKKIEILNALLLKGLSIYRERGRSLQGPIHRIVHRSGQVPIDELACDLGISGRQLERRFLREVGLGPKLLSRILRFQQVFRAVERSDQNWARIAADCGYYDQAHLIRDFGQFAGQTPSILMDHFTPFSEFFTRKRRMSDFSKPPH